MDYQRTPFYTIESALEYTALLCETIVESRNAVAANIAAASAEGATRRRDALQLALYKLDQLAKHIDVSHRLMNDLRIIRRLLQGEREASRD
jgi:Cu/Ag efflux protein CusF